MDPNQIGNMLSGFFNKGLMTSVFKWTGYALAGVLLLGVFVGLYFMLKFKYKIYYYDRRGKFTSRKKGDEEFDLGKLKKDLAMPIKDNGASKWRLLFAGKKIAPVEYKHIYPKNKVYMLRTGESTFVPCLREKKFVAGDHIMENLEPIAYDIRFWQQNEIHQAAIETIKEDYQKKMMMWAMIVIIGCMIFAGFTIWLSINQARGAVEHIDLVATAVNSLKGIGPG